MNPTGHYALPLLEAGQAQKEITHNEALAKIDVLLHLAVESRHRSDPPGIDGTWIVPAGATGVWASHDGEIAAFDAAGWSFAMPRDGCIAYIRDEGFFVHFSGGAWRDGWAVPSLAIGGRTVLAGAVTTIPGPAGGTTVDSEARNAIAQLLTALRDMGLLAAT